MKKKGSALLVVVIIMMITLMLAAIIVETSIKSNRVALDTFNRSKAYYSAEAGIYDFINYANNNSCNVSSGTTITNLYNNGGLYGDNMALYNANLMDTITTTQVGNSKIYTLTIYSSGSYGSQGCVIIANVTIVYVNSGSGTYNYSYYTINSKKVYKA